MSKDGSMVLTAAYDKSARVWDTASGKCLAVLASSAQVVRCAVSPSGRLAATATQDHSIQIWELPSGRILQDLTVRRLHLLERWCVSGPTLWHRARCHDVSQCDCLTLVLAHWRCSDCKGTGGVVQHCQGALAAGTTYAEGCRGAEQLCCIAGTWR